MGDQHERKGDIDIFRFESVGILNTQMCALVSLGMSFVTFLMWQWAPNRDGTMFVFAAVCLGLLGVISCGLAIQRKAFLIETRQAELRIGGLGGSERTISFEHIKRIILVERRKSTRSGVVIRKSVSLLDGGDRTLLNVSSDLQDFLRFVGIVRVRTADDTVFRHLDVNGKWTEVRGAAIYWHP